MRDPESGGGDSGKKKLHKTARVPIVRRERRNRKNEPTPRKKGSRGFVVIFVVCINIFSLRLSVMLHKVVHWCC